VPHRVTLVDYNHRRPTELLVSSQKIDPTGFGHVFGYGDHFKDTGVGDARAKIRAEELGVNRRTLRGTTDCPRFRVGHVFELENHHVGEYDGEYLITAVEHRAGFEVRSLREARGAEGEEQATPYQARFTAIPVGVPFRPARITPWPRIHGVINGHVEADTSGDFAQIDDQGRYKIKLPFDVGTQKGLGSSRWIRMAQAYSGAGYGQHFPLHKGTEVLIARWSSARCPTRRLRGRSPTRTRRSRSCRPRPGSGSSSRTTRLEAADARAGHDRRRLTWATFR
jgi:type VI secretion system secreted protein VgrG